MKQTLFRYALATVLAIIVVACAPAEQAKIDHARVSDRLASDIYTAKMTNGDVCYVYSGGISCVAHPAQ